MKLRGFLLFLAVAGVACNSHTQPAAQLDTPTSGSITIAADEALQPIVEAQVAAFEGIYQQARIKTVYLPEQEAIEYVLADSAVLAIVARPFTATERERLQQSKIWPAQTKVATDALALILNRNNPDSLFTTEQLQQVLRGEVQSWGALKRGSALGNIQLVFDHNHSGSVRILRDSLARVEALPSYAFAVKSNPEVVKHVKENVASMGIVGVSWLSDQDDSLSQAFNREVRVAALFSPEVSDYLQPYQAYMAQQLYPLQRQVYVLSREARAGLGSGLTSFIASEKGQRIFLKAGLVPATMPLRIVQINQDASKLSR